jgi:hypothetical protein
MQAPKDLDDGIIAIWRPAPTHAPVANALTWLQAEYLHQSE